ncbi:flagellar hook-length control protein FliK [Rheinheimera sp.]|uniref:flagellar hook-length control protein FliK n=1 Tax=Rheinheimera sp. TaxID=1869214 RepID=UPI00307F7BF4
MTDLMITALMGRDNALNPAKSAKALVADGSDSRFSDELAQQVQAANSVTEQKRKRQILAASDQAKANAEQSSAKAKAGLVGTGADGTHSSQDAEPVVEQNKALSSAQHAAGNPDEADPFLQTGSAVPELTKQPLIHTAEPQVLHDQTESGDSDGEKVMAPLTESTDEESTPAGATEFELLKYLDHAILLGKKLQPAAQPLAADTKEAVTDAELSLQQLSKQDLIVESDLAAAPATEAENTRLNAKERWAPDATPTQADERTMLSSDLSPEEAQEQMATQTGQKLQTKKTEAGADNLTPDKDTPDTELPVIETLQSGSSVELALMEGQSSHVVAPLTGQLVSEKGSQENAVISEPSDDRLQGNTAEQTEQMNADTALSLFGQQTKTDVTPQAEGKSNQSLRGQGTEQKVSAEELNKQNAAMDLAGDEADASSQEQPGQSPQPQVQTLADGTVRPERIALQQGFHEELKAATAQEKVTQNREFTHTLNPQAQRQADLLGQKLNLIQPEASAQLKEQVMLMVRDKVQTAEIRLDPAELGSMQVKISMQQDQMSVQFVVQNGQTRDLMEQQMPRLRDLLQQQGIELSQGSVQQDSSSGRQASDGSGQGQNGRSATTGHGLGTEDDLTAVQVQVAVSDRVVDYYA